MTAAYDALSPGMKKRIEGLEAVHSLMLRHEKTINDAYYGLVRIILAAGDTPAKNNQSNGE